MHFEGDSVILAPSSKRFEQIVAVFFVFDHVGFPTSLHASFVSLATWNNLDHDAVRTRDYANFAWLEENLGLADSLVTLVTVAQTLL